MDVSLNNFVLPNHPPHNENNDRSTMEKLGADVTQRITFFFFMVLEKNHSSLLEGYEKLSILGLISSINELSKIVSHIFQNMNIPNTFSFDRSDSSVRCHIDTNLEHALNRFAGFESVKGVISVFHGELLTLPHLPSLEKFIAVETELSESTMQSLKKLTNLIVLIIGPYPHNSLIPTIKHLANLKILGFTTCSSKRDTSSLIWNHHSAWVFKMNCPNLETIIYTNNITDFSKKYNASSFSYDQITHPDLKDGEVKFFEDKPIGSWIIQQDGIRPLEAIVKENHTLYRMKILPEMPKELLFEFFREDLLIGPHD